MTKPGERKSAPKELKRIGDYVERGGSQLEGEQTDLEAILGEDIELVDFVFLKSNKYQEGGGSGEFAIMQFKRAGSDDLLTTACGGAVVMDVLKEMPKNYLPIAFCIFQDKSKAGRRFYNVR